MGEFSLKGAGFEASAKRKAEALRLSLPLLSLSPRLAPLPRLGQETRGRRLKSLQISSRRG